MATTASPSNFQHIQIRSDSNLATLDLQEIFRYRDLLLTLADRDIRVRYKQTVIGVAWVVLQPLMTSLIFAFVFGVLARLPSEGRPYILFAFSGLLAWNAFSQTLTRVSFALVGNVHLVSKVYFPRLILPLAAMASTLVDFVVALVLMFLMLIFYGVWPGWGLLLLPVWLAVMLVMALGLGLVAAALMVKYRDISHIIPTILQLGMYVTPVAWSALIVPGKFRWIFLANPLTGLLNAFRWSLLGEGALSLPALAYSTVTAALFFWCGAIVFKQQERNFADVI
ncbi:MAG TPA: ABC transporter permease [Isosphaeraceae bacterium]|jgi:lipopolysaccharide transport system permease protein|nr:ABC transporter permease [Isosphaeraceae bacterium]